MTNFIQRIGHKSTQRKHTDHFEIVNKCHITTSRKTEGKEKSNKSSFSLRHLHAILSQILFIHNKPTNSTKGRKTIVKSRILGNHNPTENIRTKGITQLVEFTSQSLTIHLHLSVPGFYQTSLQCQTKKIGGPVRVVD